MHLQSDHDHTITTNMMKTYHGATFSSTQRTKYYFVRETTNLWTKLNMRKIAVIDRECEIKIFKLFAAFLR